MPLKFRCDRNSFLNTVTNANRAVARQSPLLAALSGLYFELNGDNLAVTGSDLDLTITVMTEVAGQESGEAVIPARLLLDVIRVLPVGSLEMTVNHEEAQISTDSAEFAIKVLPTHDWPNLPLIDTNSSKNTEDGSLLETQEPEVSEDDSQDPKESNEEQSEKQRSEQSSSAEYSVTTDVGAFRDALSQVVRSASTDDTRPILTGILMSSEGDGLRLVSTDSYRLSLRDLPGATLLGKEQQVLVPGRALNELQRMIQSTDKMTLRLSPKIAEFELDRIRLTTRLIEGDFPNYRTLIPQVAKKDKSAGEETDEKDNILTVQRSRLLEAVRRVRLLAQDSTPVIIFASENNLEVRADTEAIGSASETIEAQYTGEEISIGFNPAYLIDGLEVSGAEEVTLQLQDSLKPALLSPVEDDGFLYLLMPVRIPSG